MTVPLELFYLTECYSDSEGIFYPSYSSFSLLKWYGSRLNYKTLLQLGVYVLVRNKRIFTAPNVFRSSVFKLKIKKTSLSKSFFKTLNFVAHFHVMRLYFLTRHIVSINIKTYCRR